VKALTCTQAAAMAGGYKVLNRSIEDVPVAEGAFTHVIFDPPYAKRVEERARRGHKTDTALCELMPLGFEAATSAKRASWAAWAATAAQRWVMAFSDHDSSVDWAAHLERAGLVLVRYGLWVRTGDLELAAGKPAHSGTPQFTGDRPSQGHEVIVIAHKGRRMKWNAHGRTAVYPYPVVPPSQRVHPTQKPVALMQHLIRDFCSSGQTIIDPFCGSGSTLLGAKAMGLGAAGIELDPKFASFAERRAAGFHAHTR
jgi:16S rRNA G966 N2-methylase RsmD